MTFGFQPLTHSEHLTDIADPCSTDIANSKMTPDCRDMHCALPAPDRIGMVAGMFGGLAFLLFLAICCGIVLSDETGDCEGMDDCGDGAG